MACKYCFVIGSTYSSLGKGLACGSLLYLLKQRGLSIQYLKFDPYLSDSASCLNPIEHGEVHLSDDGSESDVDLSTISSLAELETCRDNIYTTGRLYKELISSHENGKYLGQTLQLNHFSLLVQEKIKKLGETSDIVFIEIGGTCGSDAEAIPFYESIREFKLKNSKDVLIILMAPVFLINNGEWKTKPLQRSVRDLQGFSLHPDIILCRAPVYLPSEVIKKISKLTNVSTDCIFNATDVNNIYNIPLEFHKQNIDDTIADLLQLPRKSCKIHKYRQIVENMQLSNLSEITIGIVGKYNHESAYASVKESIIHASAAAKVKPIIKLIHAEQLEVNNANKMLANLDGIIIPGGFDVRGVTGKLNSIQYARENKVPILGICLGLQCMVIEFARNKCKLENANSLEFSKTTEDPVIHYVEGQENIQKKSGTMRLGSYDCELTKDSLAFECYGKKIIQERHRHRYEVNPVYINQFEANGFKVSGKNPTTNLIEIMELDHALHPYFIGTQFHGEFKSRLTSPAPLFKGLINASITYHENKILRDKKFQEDNLSIAACSAS